MSTESKIRRKPVNLAPARPSRIRRDPVPIATPESLARAAWWNSREWEIRLAIGGMIFFAIAITALVMDIGQLVGN